jgi:hypothetical protein
LTPGIVAEDALIEDLIAEAYDYLETETNRKMLGQTWKLTLDESEVSSVIRLPLVPLVSVSSIVTTDDDGDETTVAATNYQVRGGENPRIVLTDDGEWPTDMRDYDSMVITCVCGYGGSVLPFVGFVPGDHVSPGLNDLSAGGTFTGTVRTYFDVEINEEATPDTFKWRKTTRDSDGIKTVAAWSAGVAITGAAQALADGVTVKFAATTGHSDGDAWRVEMYESLPGRIRYAMKGIVLHIYTTKGRGVDQTVSGQLIGMPYQLRHMIDSLRVQAL